MKGFRKKNTIKKIIKEAILFYRFDNLFKLFICINLFLISGCSTLKKNENINICSSSKLPCIQSTEYVLLITNRGDIKLELYGELAPITVGNFINFVDQGVYNKTVFNRVIKEPYPFIIRGGGKNLLKDKNNIMHIKKSKIRNIPLEIKLKKNFLPTYGKEIKMSDLINIELKHKRSFLSMARSKKLNSANSQFYILLKNLPELDGRFAVFGKVISGMNIVDMIQEKDFIIEAKRL